MTDDDGLPDIGHNTKQHLRLIVQRLELVAAMKKALGEDAKMIMAEAEGAGFDKKAIREILKRRTWDREELERHDDVVDTYMDALGGFDGTPLGEWANAQQEAEAIRRRFMDGDPNDPLRVAKRQLDDLEKERAEREAKRRAKEMERSRYSKPPGSKGH